MSKRDLVDELVGPRVREMMDQLLCMKGMTNTEKVDFLMSRNRELRAENDRLRELVRDMARAWWACDNERCPHGSSCDAAVSEGKLADCEMERRMAELGIEVVE